MAVAGWMELEKILTKQIEGTPPMTRDTLQQIAERLLSNSWDTYLKERPRDWESIADAILLDARAVANAYLAERAKVERQSNIISNLVMLVRRMCRRLTRTPLNMEANLKLAEQGQDYMRRAGLDDPMAILRNETGGTT